MKNPSSHHMNKTLEDQKHQTERKTTHKNPGAAYASLASPGIQGHLALWEAVACLTSANTQLWFHHEGFHEEPSVWDG
jgi:hypothetical protein